jgi:TetR/AcrR family transcriptional regulator, transcriptional repressor for nem operon
LTDRLVSRGAAGVKKGSFYHFFPGKEELALAALETHWARRRPVLDAMFSPTVPPLERLENYFAFIFERQSELKRETGHVLGCFYFSFGGACLEHPRIAARVREIVATYERYYESALREAQARGLIEVRDPAEKAHSLFTYMEGIMADARIRNSTDSLLSLPRLAMEFLGVEGGRSPGLQAAVQG